MLLLPKLIYRLNAITSKILGRIFVENRQAIFKLFGKVKDKNNQIMVLKEKKKWGLLLAVQWLRLHASTARVTG